MLPFIGILSRVHHVVYEMGSSSNFLRLLHSCCRTFWTRRCASRGLASANRVGYLPSHPDLTYANEDATHFLVDITPENDCALATWEGPLYDVELVELQNAGKQGPDEEHHDSSQSTVRPPLAEESNHSGEHESLESL